MSSPREKIFHSLPDSKIADFCGDKKQTSGFKPYPGPESSHSTSAFRHDVKSRKGYEIQAGPRYASGFKNMLLAESASRAGLSPRPTYLPREAWHPGKPTPLALPA